MKRNLLTLAFLVMAVCAWASSPVKAVKGLIERVTPGYSSQYKLEMISSADGCDVYEIDNDGSHVVLRGNNAVSLATAFNQFLKYTCNAHVSWFGDQLSLPSRLPLPQHKRNTINGKYRVYMNYCTVSYTAAWWNWERWQREIDYMAMNSINMPLFTVGLEAVWYNVLLRHGFTDLEARQFLAGPAHAAWQWMQNLQSYGGPLPKSWIDKHARLGKQIVDREIELGMHPIQQGFSGYVPREMKDKYPAAAIRQQPSWCSFKGAAQLDPTDPLFARFGREFLEEEKKLYGAHGVYAADPFHESKPPVDTPEYLHAVGEAIHKLFEDFDPNSIWAMQAWSLRESIVKAVPKEGLLILDLNGKRSSQPGACWGYPLVAGNLHNFGGRVNMHGDLPLLASNQYEKAVKVNPNVCGSGLFMESIEQNPVYYDLAFEMPLNHGEVNLERWLCQYARRRYGAASSSACQAWAKLLAAPYCQGTNGVENSSIIAARPALDVKKSGPNAGFHIPYNPHDLVEAEALLLADSARLGGSKPYRFDIVDVQRQVMSNLGQRIQKKVTDAFRRKDKKAFELHSQRFLQLLRDVDTLLHTRSEYSLYRWIDAARSWGDNDEERDMFERDATALVTIWGPDDKPSIFDYSWREWAGLIDGYYLQRWTKFFDMLKGCLDNNVGYTEEGLPQVYGREAFRTNKFYDSLADWELQFVNTYNKFSGEPIAKGDEIVVASQMFKKYAALEKEY